MKSIKLVRPEFLLYGILIPFSLFWLLMFWYLRNPIVSSGKAVTDSVVVDVNRLKADTYELSGIQPNRYFKNVESVLKAEKFVINRLQELGYQPKIYDVYAFDRVFHNILFRYESGESKDVAVIGAH